MADLIEITEEIKEYPIYLPTDNIEWALKAAGWGLNILKKDLVDSIAWSLVLGYLIDHIISEYLAPRIGVDAKLISWGTAFGAVSLIIAINKLENVIKNIEGKQGLVFIFKTKAVNTGTAIVVTIYGFDVETY